MFTTEMRLSRLTFFLLALLLEVASAQSGVDLKPVSREADAAYLQSPTGQRTPLLLNKPNPIDTSFFRLTESSVVFTKSDFLDRVIPYDPIFLKDGFPGNFDNLERRYEVKLPARPVDARLYEVNRSSGTKDQKHYLGQLGDTSLWIDREHYYNSTTGTFSKVGLQVERDGYETKSFEISAQELVPSKVLPEVFLQPAEGFGNLWARWRYRFQHTSLPIKIAAIAGVFSICVGGVIWRRRASALKKFPPLERLGMSAIGKYRVLRSVGRGGTAEVYEAVSQDDSASIPVAIKLMHETAGEVGGVERFRREIQSSLKLHHKGLAEIYDWGEHNDGRLYLVCELLQGETLKRRIAKNENLSREFIIDLLEQLGATLTYLHEQGFVHRDVKPDNIFLTEKGEAKLVDLGIAKGQDLAPLTEIGLIVGTPHYLAPEQAHGQATPQSDQYALGIIVFELLTGRRPYGGQETSEIVKKHLSSPVPRLRQFASDSSEQLESVLVKVMAKRPANRYPNVTEAVRALCEALQKGPKTNDDTEAFSL